MDRLLTDEEMRIESVRNSDWSDEQIWGQITAAQDVKTLKAVGEWGDTFCVVHEHYGSDKRANTRKRECRQCWQQLKQGKMPE